MNRATNPRASSWISWINSQYDIKQAKKFIFGCLQFMIQWLFRITVVLNKWFYDLYLKLWPLQHPCSHISKIQALGNPPALVANSRDATAAPLTSPPSRSAGILGPMPRPSESLQTMAYFPPQPPPPHILLHLYFLEIAFGKKRQPISCVAFYTIATWYYPWSCHDLGSGRHHFMPSQRRCHLGRGCKHDNPS